MPKIKLNDVLRFSSEDAVHVAKNVLTTDPTKTWKTKTAGEKTAFIILQLDKPTLISALDIGNNNSAYIEVLVTRSGLSDDYKVLLVMSAFMSPLESRQGLNVNKVRMFKKEHFVENVANEKWDRVKVVCTQIFNRSVQFGLSFIAMYARDGMDSEFGRFAVREESPERISVGNLFKRRKELVNDAHESKGVAESIREATSSFLKNSDINKEKLPENTFSKKILSITPDSEAENSRKSRNRTGLFFDTSQVESNSKVDKIVEAREHENGNKDELRKTDNQPKNPAKRTSLQPEESYFSRSKKRKRNTRKFSELLRDVTLVISGIKNPDRAMLRTLAMEMGAKYKRDWDDGCTHLICAFANTPKFYQVKGKRGKIVTRKWVEDCYEERRRFPWRRYALDTGDRSFKESEDEILEETQTSEEDSDDELRDAGSATEAEVQMIHKQSESAFKDDDSYDVDTEEETFVKTTGHLSDQLPKFFAKKMFYIEDSLVSDELRLVKRYIEAYAGVCHEVNRDVDFVVTSDEGCSTNLDACKYVTPKWIIECHNVQELLPF